jgi:hypothetical protein
VLDPLLVKLLEAVEETASNEAVQEQIDQRRDICSSNAFASAMSLDMSVAPQPLPDNKQFLDMRTVSQDNILVCLRNA